MGDVIDIREIPAWNVAVEAWLQHCEGDGLTPSSIDNYSSALLGARMPAFRAAHGIDTPADLTPDLLETFKQELRRAGLRAATVGHYFRAIKTFARFCIDAGWIQSPDLLTVRSPKQPKLNPPTFTDGDVSKLLAACVCERDRVLVELAIESGLRRGEIVRLELEDVVAGHNGWLVRVRQGKGRKDRQVPISDAFAETLQRYIANVRPTTTSRAVFVNTKRSANGEYEPLTGDGMYRIWNRIGRATGIHAYPHKGRHSFATRAAQDGVAPWAIQGALGHSSIQMTERYVRVAAVDLSDAFAKARDEAGGSRVAAKVIDIRKRLEERSPAPFWVSEFLPASVAKSYIGALTSMSLAFAKYARIDGAELASLIATAMSVQSSRPGAAGIDEATVAILEAIDYW
jgi:integrase